MKRSVALAPLPRRCVVCANVLRTDASRERGLGPECAALLTPDVPPRWDEAKRSLVGAVDLRAMSDHWRVSPGRVAARLVAMAAAGTLSTARASEAVAALGFERLSRALGVRRPLSPKTTPEQKRRAFRQLVSAERLHPDQGGDLDAFRRAAAAVSSHR